MFRIFSHWVFLFFVLSSYLLYGQLYSGPKSGSIDSGAVNNTDRFFRTVAIGQPTEKVIRNELEYKEKPDYLNSNSTALSSNYFADPSLAGSTKDTAATMLLQNFSGIPQTNSIPPDPYIAVGSTHLVATVNSKFAIWDKEGNLIKSIDANKWFESVYPNNGAFDPKIIYDHFNKRWVMVWLEQNTNNKTSHLLISVSDDSIPTGTWYNWALPGNTNGNVNASNWSDYEGLGFDKDAIYITSNQFTFDTAAVFQYAKIRIIPKNLLYANTGGKLTWYDLWDIHYPSGSGKIFTLRPSIIYGNSNAYYLLSTNYSSSTYMSLYKIVNPVISPVMTASKVPINYYSMAPQANQLDGGTLIEGGGSAIRNEPKYMDGYLWAVHSVANPKDSKYSNLRYVKIDVSSNTTVEDVSFGAPGYWHYYPAIAVDKDHNVAISYTRSGDTEYAGAYYTSRLNSDPAGLSASKVLQPGKGNYVKTFGGDRNRWGDYNGILLDPADQNNIWMFTEYASSKDTWGTWVGKIRMVPFPGTSLTADKQALDFGSVEIYYNSDTLKTTLSNLGKDDVIITNIADSVGPFSLASKLSLPVILHSYDSLEISIVFTPDNTKQYDEFLSVISNDTTFSGFNLKGKGYEITPAIEHTLYAASGSGNNGAIITIDPNSGAGNTIGSSLFNAVTSISVDPYSKKIFGLISYQDKSEIIKVNALHGDSYHFSDIPVGNMAAISFDTSGVLYAASKTGTIYIINKTDGDIKEVSSSKINISGLAFNPKTNELYASVLVIIGVNKDKIFKIDVTTGDTTFVGKTGTNLVTKDLVFDETGKLYGVIGTSNQANSLININPLTASGTIIGVIGFNDITSLAYLSNTITSTEKERDIVNLPHRFNLSQNYPNPFNPSTKIEYALPHSASVKLVVYNLLGEVVTELVNSHQEAGYYSVVWNSNDFNGKKLSSGIYFYELIAKEYNGKTYEQIKKMVLLK